MVQRILLLGLFIVLVGGGCKTPPREIVIFHTNDLHGHFLAEPASWRDDHAPVGGAKAMAFYLDSLRRRYPHSIYLDAGDVMTGNPICNLSYDGVQGGALLEILKRCGLRAACLGNHEFDLGPEHLRDFIAAAPFPILCANVRDKKSGNTITGASQIFTVNNIRIGVIGLILDDLAAVASKSAVDPFLVDAAASVAQKQINDLDPKTDLIVLLTHLGADEDSVLATKIHAADVIVGGHSHTKLDQPKKVNGMFIVQTGSYWKNLGMLQLKIGGDSVVSGQGQLIELVEPAHLQMTALNAFVDSIGLDIQTKYGKIIGDLQQAWKKSYYSGSNVGNWICDRLCERYHTDVAMVNAAGIRADLEPGSITMLDIMELLPFVNKTVVFEATGAELLFMAREQARAQAFQKHGVLEMSGMLVRYRKDRDDVDIRQIMIGNHALDVRQTYRVASIDFVAVSQWDRYLGFAPRNLQEKNEQITDVVIDEIQKITGPISADALPRLVEAP
jgi:2',3'-cyclic-nucleotide 2'-phosphodiesterase (5'-nucleotidase family)